MGRQRLNGCRSANEDLPNLSRLKIQSKHSAKACDLLNYLRGMNLQFQGKESTDIPEEVYDKLWGEIKKNRIEDMSTLTNAKMREFLKKHKLNKYYEHINYLLYRMCSNSQPPTISKADEERLCNAFKQIQGPFAESVHASARRNFISYSYCLYKLSQLFEFDHLLPFFSLLKSREKLAIQDRIWKDIIAHPSLNWEWIPTVQ